MSQRHHAAKISLLSGFVISCCVLTSVIQGSLYFGLGGSRLQGVSCDKEGIERTDFDCVLFPKGAHTLLLASHPQLLVFTVSRYPDLLTLDSQNDLNTKLSNPFLDFRFNDELEIMMVI